MNITDNVVRTATEALCASFACSPEAVVIDRATGNTTINGKPVGRLVIRGTEPGALPIGDRDETARALTRLLSGGPDEIMSLIGRIATGKRGVTTSPATGWDVGTYFTVLGITPTGFKVRRDDGVEGVIDPTFMRAIRTGDPADPINRKTLRVRVTKEQNSEWYGEYDAVPVAGKTGWVTIQHPKFGEGTFLPGDYDVINEAFETRPAEFSAQDVEGSGVGDDCDDDESDDDIIDADYDFDDEDVDAPDRPVNHGRLWSSYDTTRAIEGYRSGRSVETIGEELGRSPFAVVCKLTQRGVLTEQQREVFRETDTLEPIVFQGVLYFEGAWREFSGAFDSVEQVHRWFEERTDKGERFMVVRTCGDKVEQTLVERSVFTRADDTIVVELKGRFWFKPGTLKRFATPDAFVRAVQTALEDDGESGITGLNRVRFENATMHEDANFATIHTVGGRSERVRI